MNKLISTAKKLSTFFKIAEIALMIAAVSCVVGAVIVAAGLIFDLPPEYIGTGFNVIEIDFLEINVAEDFAPDIDTVLIHWLTITSLAAVCAFIIKLCARCIKNMLLPMSQGEPFNSAVSENLKKIAIYSIIFGVAGNILIITNQLFLVFGCGLQDILTNDKITSVGAEFSLDLSFAVVAAILFLLSYIFKYGEELQKQADETL